MTLLKVFTLKNKSKKYKTKTFIGSHDGAMGSRFTLCIKKQGKRWCMKQVFSDTGH